MGLLDQIVRDLPVEIGDDRRGYELRKFYPVVPSAGGF